MAPNMKEDNQIKAKIIETLSVREQDKRKSSGRETLFVTSADSQVLKKITTILQTPAPSHGPYPVYAQCENDGGT